MRCPSCGTAVLFESAPAWTNDSSLPTNMLPNDSRFVVGVLRQGVERLVVSAGRCPSCERVTVVMAHATKDTERSRIVWPENVVRAPIPDAVPPHIAEDFREAVLVLGLSPKASAALSRRCLQHLLREQGYPQNDLVAQIDAARAELPRYIGHELDVVRVVGNFAAHPMKARHTGEILGVEDGEAEWTIEVLEMLFDHYYLRPSDVAARRNALNDKLSKAGKKPLPPSD